MNEALGVTILVNRLAHINDSRHTNSTKNGEDEKTILVGSKLRHASLTRQFVGSGLKWDNTVGETCLLFRNFAGTPSSLGLIAVRLRYQKSWQHYSLNVSGNTESGLTFLAGKLVRTAL